jgi:hypothetical protein
MLYPIDKVQPLHYFLSMPLIIRFRNCSVYINLDDHNPPHFHIRSADGREAWITIETLEVLSSSVPKREFTEPLSWAKDNKNLLLEKFKEYNQ